MSLLSSLRSPADLRLYDNAQLEQLADEIRQFIIDHVSITGGHLGPNLGVVEVTMAAHLVFDSPAEPIIFDTGHQSYVHKILTGRADQFSSLRQKGGLSGYPAREESEHDWVENSHASTSLSWAAGMARGFRLRGEERSVVAIIGDGALTGGMAWEALNNIAVTDDPLVIVVNDNGRSYAPTIGGFSRYLTAIRTDPRYESALDQVREQIKKAPLGRQTYDLLHGLKAGIKDVIAPQGMFADLGLKYIGPVDGHDLSALVTAFRQAKRFGGPVIVHAITQKGKGYRFAEEYDIDLFHSVGPIDSTTGKPLNSGGESWTSAFSDLMVRHGAERDDLVALTAAMLEPVGLAPFAKRWPERVFDVGIAEQHALTSAAGLASAGFHPVVCLYSTFLNRAFDQLLMDVTLHHLPLTIILDRAGVTGSDGASHNGIWDVAICGTIPTVEVYAPRDHQCLEYDFAAALDVDDHPVVIRYSKDALPHRIEPVEVGSAGDILFNGDGARILLIAWGQMCSVAYQAAKIASEQGISVTVIDPRRMLPISDTLVDLVAEFDAVITIEDNLICNGAGSQLSARVHDCDVAVNIHHIGVSEGFLPHASRAQIMKDEHMDLPSIVEAIQRASDNLSRG